MKIPFRLIGAHARRNKFRTLLTLGSVFVAMLVFGSLRTMVDSLQATLLELSSTRLVSECETSLFESLPIRMYREIAELPGIKRDEPDKNGSTPVPHVTHFTWFGGTYVDERNFFARFGVDPTTLAAVYRQDIETFGDEGESSEEIWRRFAETRTGCIVGKELKEKYKWNVGDTVTLTGSIFPGTYKMEIVGFYLSKVPSYDESTLYMQWEFLNETSKANGGPFDVVSIYAVGVEDPDRAGLLADSIDALYANSDKRTRTQTERAFNAQFASMWGGMPVFFNFLGIVALAASLVIALNTAILNQRERVREVGVLKTLGFTDASVLLVSLVDSVVVFGIGGSLAILPIMAMNKKVVPGLNFPLFVQEEIPLLLASLSVGLGVVAGIFPALAASRLKIVDALRRRA
jgi:putative ABC transport system permease protein